MRPHIRCLRLTAILGSLFIAGCGEDTGGIEFGSATGTVSLNDAPLSGARVTATPEKGPLAIGVTDDSGKFTLYTGSSAKVAVGTINVAVQVGEPGATSEDVSPITNSNDPAAGAAAMAEAMAKHAQSQRKKDKKKASPLEKYADPKKSGLTFTIKSGANDLPIKLK